MQFVDSYRPLQKVNSMFDNKTAQNTESKKCLIRFPVDSVVAILFTKIFIFTNLEELHD